MRVTFIPVRQKFILIAPKVHLPFVIESGCSRQSRRCAENPVVVKEGEVNESQGAGS